MFGVLFLFILSEHILGDMGVRLKIPTPEDLGFVHNGEKKVYQVRNNFMPFRIL